MASPELNKIEVGDELENAELSLITDLKLDAFNEDTNTEDIDELKTTLKTAKINVITSEKDAETETKEEQTLSEIATAFSMYVEKKPEGRWLQLIEANKSDAPAWIKHIIENPQNNDLAYFIQKLSALIEYQTAKAYTADELTAVEVSIDKTFGNQTRRALIGLKSWIENEWDYKNIAEGQTYTGKYLNKSFVEWVVSTKTTDEEKNTVLAKYNLQYADGQIQPKDGYEFVDPYSNNLAVVQWSGDSFDVKENVSYKKAIRSEIDKITDANVLLNDYHLTRSSEKNEEGRWEYTPQSWYVWVDKDDMDNLAVKKKVKSQSGDQTDNIEKYQPENVVYDDFDQEYLTWLTSILNDNKKDIVAFLKSTDTKYLWAYASYVSLINEDDIRVTITWQELSVNIIKKYGIYETVMKSIKIKTSAAIDADMNYDKESFTKALKDQLIKEYIQVQYKNIPVQAKSRIYTIADSNNVKIQTFIKDNDFNNVNILNYAALDSSNNLIVKVPAIIYGKTIKNTKELNAIKIDVKKIIDWNNIDFEKLKTLLDAEISKMIWVDISTLSSMKNMANENVLIFTYRDFTYEFTDKNVKEEFLRIINMPNQDYICKNWIVYDPPIGSSKDKVWYKVKWWKLYKYGSGHNRSNARVYNSTTKQYDVDNNSANNRTDTDRIS